MSGNKNKNKETFPKCQDGKPCKLLAEYQDIPNKYGSLKFRAVYSIISFFILGFNQVAGTSFFTSLLMYTVPILYDNIKFSPSEKSRRGIKYILEFVLWCQVLIGILGMIGILQCINDGGLSIKVSSSNLIFEGFEFKLFILWLTIGIDVILTVADTLLARPRIPQLIIEGQLNL
ncbi:hypothetical protein GKZ28_14610 [Clostridium chromiireducens]|uniref:Uncharacterized protein n=1 Tax=Clostridium chromiireducens TaxID=225345 RepID=A0A964RNM2_9CLOT|nr:hypothetical protein [Clostridium chromiireducens]MVX64924.1 hypothetical protein [Clostridium chromiireducens]